MIYVQVFNKHGDIDDILKYKATKDFLCTVALFRLKQFFIINKGISYVL